MGFENFGFNPPIQKEVEEPKKLMDDPDKDEAQPNEIISQVNETKEASAISENEINFHEGKIVEFQTLLDNLGRLGPWWTTLVAEINVDDSKDINLGIHSDLINLSGMGSKLKVLLETLRSGPVNVNYLGYHENDTSKQIDVTNALTERGDVRDSAWQEADEIRKARALIRQQL